MSQQQSQSLWASWLPAAFTVVLPAVAREATRQNKVQQPPTLAGIRGNPWRAQGHYWLILFPVSFRSSSVAASRLTVVRFCFLSGPMTNSPNCTVWICLKHQRMMLVIQLCAAPKWHALQLAKAFRAAQTSVELRLAITNAASVGTAAGCSLIDWISDLI